MSPSAPELVLSLPLADPYLGVATGFAESAGRALGLGDREALKLTLACEEVFAYLARHAARPGDRVTLEAGPGGHRVILDLSLPSREVDLRALNLTARPSPDQEADLEELGLIIASRTLDGLAVRFEEGSLGLRLIQEKAYPAPDQTPPPPASAAGGWRVVPAGPEELFLTARRLGELRGRVVFPAGLEIPGRLADMVAGGGWGAAVAAAPDGQVVGAMLWWRAGGRTVYCSGPYVFALDAGPDLAQGLVEACLAALAKSDAVGLACPFATPWLPADYFEELGSLERISPDQGRSPWPWYFRQLKEDPGAQLWVHPDQAAWVEAAVRGLFLAREVNQAPAGSPPGPHSVLAADLDRPAGLASLRPMVDGADLGENLARHVELLGGEGLGTILCLLDLGRSWQARCAPDLAAAGFGPRLLLPGAGRGDLLVLQHGGA